MLEFCIRVVTSQQHVMNHFETHRKCIEEKYPALATANCEILWSTCFRCTLNLYLHYSYRGRKRRPELCPLERKIPITALIVADKCFLGKSVTMECMPLNFETNRRGNWFLCSSSAISNELYSLFLRPLQL